MFLDLKMTHAISVNGLAKPKFKVYSSRIQDHGNWKLEKGGMRARFIINN